MADLRRLALTIAIVVMAVSLGVAAVSAAPEAIVPGSDLTEALAVMATYEARDPGLRPVFERCAGRAVFPRVERAPLGVGGTRGSGYVYHGQKLIGWATLTQKTLGGESRAFSEVLCFKDEAALDHFRRSPLRLDAHLLAISLSDKASSALTYHKGVAIVTLVQDQPGSRVPIGAQKISFHPVTGHRGS